MRQTRRHHKGSHLDLLCHIQTRRHRGRPQINSPTILLAVELLIPLIILLLFLKPNLSNTAKVPHAWDFFHDQVGWNDRMPNINAAIGCSQLEKLNHKLKLKRILHSNFVQSFKDVKDAEIIKEAEDCQSNYWLITLRLKGKNIENLRNNILKEAHKLKIYIRPSWILLNELPMYKNCNCGDLTEAKSQSKRLLNLPSSPQLIK